MNPYNNDNNLKREELSFEKFLSDILNELGEKVCAMENQENINNKAEKAKIKEIAGDKKEKCTPHKKYIPQIGDEIHIFDGDFKGLKGEIIAEVEAYDSYQIKLSDINAIYVPKNLVKVIKKKSDKEKEERIIKLQEEIDKLVEAKKESYTKIRKLNELLSNKRIELKELLKY